MSLAGEITTEPVTTKTKSGRKAIIGGMLGNGLEWYDYALYGHMSIIFSKIFFPSDMDASFSLILTYLTFAIGFISRPLGAIFFGRMGDKFGRKKALIAALIMMAIPTACIGLLPTYEMIGIAAPILLLCIRILQGLSLGGAYGGSISYVVEHAPAHKRSTIGSVIKLSLVIGFLMGSLISTIMANSMSEEAFMSWGWRIPFISGLAIAFVGYFIREHGEESPIYEEAKRTGKLSSTPVKDAFCKYPMCMVKAFGSYISVTIPFYIIAIYMIAYTTNYLGQPESDALMINTIAMFCMLLTVFPAAWLADRVGRKPILIGAILIMVAVAVPAFLIMPGSDFTTILIFQCLMGATLGIYLAPIPAFLVEMFPTSVRNTGMSLSYNVCAIVGGFTPSISEWLVRASGSPSSIMYLSIGAAITSLAVLIPYKDRWKEPLT